MVKLFFTIIISVVASLIHPNTAQDAKNKAAITLEILYRDVSHHRAVVQHLPLYIKATTTSRDRADIWWSQGLSCVTAIPK